MDEPNSADPQDASKGNVISLNKTGGGANGMHLRLECPRFFAHLLSFCYWFSPEMTSLGPMLI